MHTKLDDVVVERDLAHFDVRRSTQLSDDISRIDREISHPHLLKGKLVDMQSKLEDLQQLRAQREEKCEVLEELNQEEFRHRGT